MDKREWVILAAFMAAVYGLSFVSPAAAIALSGFVAVNAFVNGDIAKKVLGGN